MGEGEYFTLFFGAMAMTLSRRGEGDGDDRGVTVINEGGREIPLKEEASMEEREEGACIASLFSFSLSLSLSLFLSFVPSFLCTGREGDWAMAIAERWVLS